MKIIFVKEHIFDDEFGIKVHAGQTGVLLNDSTGLIELDTQSIIPDDDDDDLVNGNKQIVFGIIDGVQPSCYIPLRDDV